jgi:hypothetical protein
VLGGSDGEFQAQLPISPAPTTYYYFVDGAEPATASTPHVFFVSSDHWAISTRTETFLMCSISSG